jgi:hypothetical protein
MSIESRGRTVTRNFFPAALAALSVMCPAVAFAVAPAPEQETALVPTRIEFDNSALGPGQQMADKLLPTWVSEAFVADYDLRLVDDDDAAEATVQFVLSWASLDDLDWKIEVSVVRDGRTRFLDPFVCEQCPTEDEVAARIRQQMPQIVEMLRADKADRPAGDPAHGKGERPPDDLGPESRRRGDLDALGRVGIGSMSLGAAALIAGGVMIGLDRRGGANPFDESANGVALRPPGIGVAVGGGVALVTGIVLLAVDLRPDRKTAIAPTLGRRLVGLSLTTRF